MIKFNNKTVNRIYKGDEQVNRLNDDANTIFQYIKVGEPTPVPYEEQYLTIQALTDGILEINLFDEVDNVFYYSRDKGVSWDVLTSQTIDANETVLLKCENPAVGNQGIGLITFNGQFNVYGNVMSLIYGDDFVGQTVIPNSYEFKSLFDATWKESYLISAENLILPATTLAEGCYSSMFSGCRSLTTAPELPALNLARYCYYNMFGGCTSLTTVPELPAETLVQYCYYNMFAGCTSLTTAPELPATTLAEGCYNNMFSGCRSLTTAPELSATTLAQSCYTYMFFGCTNLNYIKCLATNISASQCTQGWVHGVASTGTFVKAASMALTSWTTGNNGIPNGWTVQNNDGSPVIYLKYTATYTNGTVVTASCNDSGSVLVRNEISKTNLKTVVLGECVTRISGECFSDCSKLESVTIEGNTTIDAYSFARNNGTLKTIRMQATTPPQCDSTAFTYHKSGSRYVPMESIRIYVPSASVSRYKAASGWKTYSSKIYGY